MVHSGLLTVLRWRRDPANRVRAGRGPDCQGLAGRRVRVQQRALQRLRQRLWQGHAAHAPAYAHRVCKRYSNADCPLLPHSV